MKLPKPTKKKKIHALLYALENYIRGLFVVIYTITLTIYFPIEILYRANSSMLERKSIYYLSILIHFIVSYLITIFVNGVYEWCKYITKEDLLELYKRIEKIVLLLVKIGIVIIGVSFTIKTASVIVTTIDIKVVLISILLVVCIIILAKSEIVIRKNITYRYWYKYYTTSPDSEIIMKYVNSTITHFLNKQHPPIDKTLSLVENYEVYKHLLLPYLEKEFGSDQWVIQKNRDRDFWGNSSLILQLSIKNPKGTTEVKMATLELKLKYFSVKLEKGIYRHVNSISLEVLDFDRRIIYCANAPL